MTDREAEELAFCAFWTARQDFRPCRSPAWHTWVYGGARNPINTPRRPTARVGNTYAFFENVAPGPMACATGDSTGRAEPNSNAAARCMEDYDAYDCTLW